MRHLQFTAGSADCVRDDARESGLTLVRCPRYLEARVAIDHDEIALLAHLLRHCDPNPIVVDVGANIGDLYHRPSFRYRTRPDSRAVVRFHNKRGMAEQRIKGKQALKMARLIQHVFGPSPPVDHRFI